ncbi:hypothetical protein [Hymenobacter chitinivorans]|uniref:DUF3806 domain-containing protein n=1 Tax=Hymenobacter chitinivorans DSM 11115 TaxID=1121954 RepID=A0A2M9BLF5_9BACT|nr:hypothetical protein [Hymenobacter chitinivorans]PJJ58786.1 hypothetical protein CLV45_0196 [Hymenobacter chitinivorans DSM 11115]
MSSENPLIALRRAAEAVRQQLQVTDFDAAGVQRLDAFINEQRGSVKDAEREGVISALGCFLGQCLVSTYQGEWALGPDKSTGVGIADKHFFNPFYRVSQQLAHGQKESVAVFFAGVPERLAVVPRRKNWI